MDGVRVGDADAELIRVGHEQHTVLGCPGNASRAVCIVEACAVLKISIPGIECGLIFVGREHGVVQFNCMHLLVRRLAIAGR